MTGNRNEDKRNIVVCMFVGFMGVLGLASGEMSAEMLIMEIILIVLMSGAGIWGIVNYRRTYMKKEVIRTEKRKKYMQKKSTVLPEK